MAYRKNLNSIGMQKSSSFYAHSRNSGATESRGACPHSRTKIKLVSPLKNIKVKPKENNPPSATAHNFYTKSSESIELGGKSILNQTSQASFMRSSKPAVQKRPESIFMKAPQICLGQQVLRVQSPQRAVSPQRVCINNKCFDIGAIRSQVVLVTPLHRLRTSVPINATRSPLPQPAWPTELVIQEQNAMEELKESYESELREPKGANEPFDIELKEIQQLQKEIAQNNLQIKQLLNSSRVSRELNSSRLHQPLLPSEENFAAEVLSQTQPIQLKVEQHLRIEQHAPQVSVQTDELSIPIQQNESRWSKFSISRSKECQIQLVCSRQKQQTSRAKEEEKTDNQDAKSIKQEENSVKQEVKRKNGSRQLIQSQISHQYTKQVVLERPSSEKEVGAYAINLNLKVSRACSEASAIQQSHIQIEFQQNKQRQPEKLNLAQQQHPQPNGMAEVVASVISSGKRRINNSIYL